MKTKLLLVFLLILSSGISGCSRAGIPPVEYTQNYFSEQMGSNRWSGRTFSEILPAQEIKRIILFDDRSFRNPFFPKSPREIQIQCNTLFSLLEDSDGKTVGPYMADNEGMGSQFIVITGSGDVFQVQALSRMDEAIWGSLVSNQGLEVRINLKNSLLPGATNPPVVNTGSSLPPVETDYLLDQKSGDWVGRRLEQIIPLRKIKRIVLLEETTDIVDYFPKESNAPEQQEHQIGYSNLFDQFEASGERSKTVSAGANESPFARLLLFSSSGEMVYLEIIGESGRFENGTVVGRRISGLILHGSGKSVRLDLNIPPASSSNSP